MNATSRHANQHASALQKYADNVEHIGANFFVKSKNVLESLGTQKNLIGPRLGDTGYQVCQ